MIHAVIVEDDPMVAQINRQYLQQHKNFVIDAIFTNGEDAFAYLMKHPVDLAVVDVYMPGISGIELLHKMRISHLKTSVIMVTAAAEMVVVEEALHLGIVDYLIKPFSFQRFQEAVQKYLVKADLLRRGATLDQTTVDRLIRNEVPPSEQGMELGKGLNQKTLQLIYHHLQMNPEQKHTCESISAAANLSKVTIRRYLNYLIESGRVTSSIDYETGGRPRVLYRMR